MQAPRPGTSKTTIWLYWIIMRCAYVPWQVGPWFTLGECVDLRDVNAEEWNSWLKFKTCRWLWFTVRTCVPQINTNAEDWHTWLIQISVARQTYLLVWHDVFRWRSSKYAGRRKWRAGRAISASTEKIMMMMMMDAVMTMRMSFQWTFHAYFYIFTRNKIHHSIEYVFISRIVLYQL